MQYTYMGLLESRSQAWQDTLSIFEQPAWGLVVLCPTSRTFRRLDLRGDGQGAEVVLWSPVGRKQVGKLFDQRLQELEKMTLTYFN